MPELLWKELNWRVRPPSRSPVSWLEYSALSLTRLVELLFLGSISYCYRDVDLDILEVQIPVEWLRIENGELGRIRYVVLTP